MSTLSIDGERISGQDIRGQNVTACLALANIVKSSLGPVGLDKMLVSLYYSLPPTPSPWSLPNPATS